MRVHWTWMAFMARKHHKISNRMLVVWLTLGGFILLLVPERITSKFHGAFASIFRLPLKMGRAVSLSTQMVDSPHKELQNRQAQYLNHIDNLTAQLEDKLRQIESLSGLRQRQNALEGAALLEADVISASLEGPRNELIINRGQNDGLEAGNFVIGDNSVIGVISDIWPRTSKVQLITDIGSKTSVTINGLDKPAWMFGGGDGYSQILWVKNKIQPGTSVISEKQPGKLDCSMVIGKVTSSERNNQNALLWNITVKPACDILMLRSVTVIIMNPVK